MGAFSRKIQDQHTTILPIVFITKERRQGAIDTWNRLGAGRTQRRSDGDDIDSGYITIACQPAMELVDLPITGDAPVGNAVAIYGLSDQNLRVASSGPDLIRRKTFDRFKRAMKPKVRREDIINVVNHLPSLKHTGIFEQKSITRQQVPPDCL